jgi:ABC-type antimicrobial peptide transport system permease subunit
MNLVLRTNVDPTSVMPAVRASLRSAEKGMLIGEVSTLEQRLARSVSPRRLNLVLLSLFSATTLLLSVIGLYGVMSHLLSQRTREIGIRMALGARTIDIMRQVSGQGLVLIGWGVALGTLGALVLTRSVSTLLFGVSPTDPAVFASVGLLLSFVAILACCIPARRATRLNPVSARRQD